MTATIYNFGYFGLLQLVGPRTTKLRERASLALSQRRSYVQQLGASQATQAANGYTLSSATLVSVSNLDSPSGASVIRFACGEVHDAYGNYN